MCGLVTREGIDGRLRIICRSQVPTEARAGELLALQWTDLSWRGSFIQVRRNLVRGQLTTPKNHQGRRVDTSRQLRAELRLWRRRQRAEWLRRGQSLPEWIFVSAAATPLDESNVRKALNRMLNAAGLHRRGPHRMRHTFAIKAVGLLDETPSAATPAQPPGGFRQAWNALSAFGRMVSLTVASWNQVAGWLRRLERLRRAG